MSIPPFLTPPAGVTQSRVGTDRGSFAVLDNAELVPEPRGTALLVPGFTGSKEDFIALLKPLADRGLRGVALDLSGQFETPLAEDGAGCTLAGFASDVLSVAATLTRPLALVGHSFGGLVVREAVLSNPLAADGLVLIASGRAALPDAQQQVLQRFSQVMRAHGLEAVWQGKRALDAAAGVVTQPQDIDDFLTRRFLSNAPASLIAMITELCGAVDRTESLSTVAPPTVVVVSERDDVWPLDEQREVARQLDATLVELPDAGHSPAVDSPSQVADAIALLQCFG